MWQCVSQVSGGALNDGDRGAGSGPGMSGTNSIRPDIAARLYERIGTGEGVTHVTTRHQAYNRVSPAFLSPRPSRPSPHQSLVEGCMPIESSPALAPDVSMPAAATLSL